MPESSTQAIAPTAPTAPATPATPTTPATAAAPAPAKPATTGITVADVMKVCPDADKNNINKNYPLIAREMAAAGMVTLNQAIAAFATIAVETGSWAPIPEVGKGKGRHGIYYGRGFIQLTWRDNYIAMGKYLGIDLVGNPDRALQAELAAKIFTAFWCGKSGSPDIRPYAEKGDWQNVRSLVNAGRPGKWGICWGKEPYMKAINLGMKFLKTGIDPNAASTSLMSGDYGLGCVDTNGASARTVTASNPMSQLDALSYALGIHALDTQKTHTYEALLDAHAQPDILKLEPQKTFEAVGVGTDLDGVYTIEEVTFYHGDSLQCDLIAHKPDPNAQNPEVFMHDANATGQPAPTAANAATPAPAAGDIPAKILAAAKANKGKSTADGPEQGNTACAMAVNRFAIVPAGLKMLGDPVSPWGVPVAVAACEAALRAGRGQLIPTEQAVPGDIWVMSGQHIGICTAAGCATVLSNSSSKALFSWEGSLQSVNRVYGGKKEKVFRVLN